MEANVIIIVTTEPPDIIQICLFTSLYNIIHNVRNESAVAIVQLVCGYGQFKYSSHFRGDHS